VLVAGEDDAFLETLCREMEWGPSVEIVGHAHSLIEARALAERFAPDVVLLDLEAPGIGGAAAIHQMKTHPGTPIVLVLTSQDTPLARTESFAAGADGFVTKSDPKEKLRSLIAKIRPYL
jgi:DNA-binding NarL/FixJ family response regulator